MLFAATLSLQLAACQSEPHRIPYIPATLANWSQPYRGVDGMRVHVLNTGYLRITEALLIHGGSLQRTRTVPVPVMVIEHPRNGLVLVSTGLSPQPRAGAEPAFESLSSILFSTTAVRGQPLKAQMQAAGIKPDKVRWIILPTLRFYHTGNLVGFPEARVIVSKSEIEHARSPSTNYNQSEFAAVANWKYIDFEVAKPLATFPAAVDLFGDGSFMLLNSAGVTPGGVAVLVRLSERPLLVAGDLAPLADTLRYTAEPAQVEDFDQWWMNIWRLKRFSDLVPDLLVAPAFDVSALRGANVASITVAAFDKPPEKATASPTPDHLRRMLPAPM